MTARDRLTKALPEHQAWCHGEAHAECCGAGDCDCGVNDALDRLVPIVEALCTERAAEEIQRLADEHAWMTQHDNEVVSTSDLYDRVSRLRGAPEPIDVFDFPPGGAS